jgi:molybdopterin converting factor small subunit
MIILKVPTPLRAYTQGENEIPVHGSTVADAMQDLVEQHPSLLPHLFNSKGELRPFVNLFLNDENIRDLQGVQTPIHEGDLLKLIPSIAGG